jgi:hypothetical protein
MEYVEIKLVMVAERYDLMESINCLKGRRDIGIHLSLQIGVRGWKNYEINAVFELNY